MLNVNHISTSGVVDLLNYEVCHVFLPSSAKFEVDVTIRCLVIAFLLLIGYVTF